MYRTYYNAAKEILHLLVMVICYIVMFRNLQVF